MGIRPIGKETQHTHSPGENATTGEPTHEEGSPPKSDFDRMWAGGVEIGFTNAAWKP